MNSRRKTVLSFVADPRSLILAFAVFNFVHIWLLARNTSGGGVVSPWYFPWSDINEPTLLLAAAIFLRVNRSWTLCASFALSGYLLGYFGWLFVRYPAGIRVALHYEWASLKYQPFIDSWDCQYLFALIVFSFTILYLARGIIRWSASRRRRITNRWSGATGSEFRIRRDPAKLLGSAVARSTQPFGRLRHREEQ